MGHFVEFLRCCCKSGAPNVSQTMFLDGIFLKLVTSSWKPAPFLHLSLGLSQKGKTFRIEIWPKWAILWNF